MRPLAAESSVLSKSMFNLDNCRSAGLGSCGVTIAALPANRVRLGVHLKSVWSVPGAWDQFTTGLVSARQALRPGTPRRSYTAPAVNDHIQ